MALYEDTFQLVNPDEQAPGENYIYKGTMGPVGQEQAYYERRGVDRGVPQAPGQTQPGTGIEQDFAFLRSAISKLGFNPYTINPMGDAVKEFQANETALFNQAFGHTGMTPSTLTPEALKYWNEQKRQLINQKATELTAKAVQGKAMLDDVMKLYRERTAMEQQQQKELFAEAERRRKEGLPPMPSAQERKRMADEAQLLKMIEDLEAQLKPVDSTGVESETGKAPAEEWVGPVKGRWGQLEEKYKDLPPAQIQFYATIRDMNDFVLRVRSGAQINEQEYKRLTSFLADPNLPIENLKSRIARFKQNLKWMIGLEQQTYRQTPSSTEERTVVKKQRNTRTGQIKTIYSDGSEEIE